MIVKPGVVVGGFDVDPDCAATAAIRHATIESGEMRIMNVATRMLCVFKRRDQMMERERDKYAQKSNWTRWQDSRYEGDS